MGSPAGQVSWDKEATDEFALFYAGRAVAYRRAVAVLGSLLLCAVACHMVSLMRRVSNFTRRRFPLLQRQLQPEESIQKAFVDVLELAKPKALGFHIPNGGKRSKAVAAMMKLMGLRPGVFDFEFLLPGGRAIFIEFKAGANKLTEKQKEFAAYLVLYRFPYAVCYSVDEALKFLISQGVKFDHPERLSQFISQEAKASLSSGPGSPPSPSPSKDKVAFSG